MLFETLNTTLKYEHSRPQNTLTFDNCELDDMNIVCDCRFSNLDTFTDCYFHNLTLVNKRSSVIFNGDIIGD